MLPVVLALGTALGYGVANYLAPVLGRRMPLGAVLLGSQIAGLLVSVLLTLGGQVALTGSGLALAAAAGASNAAALACFYRAGRTGNLSVISPLGASGAVVPVGVGLVAGDRPGLPAVAGIPIVLIGIVLAARRPATDAGRRTNGVGWALAAAALFGLFLTTYAGAAAESSAGALLWSRVALVVTTAIGALVLRAPVRVRPRDAGPTLVPGLLLTLGTFAFGEATRSGSLSVVSVIATLNPVVTVALAFVLLRERPTPAQRAGAALALVGIVLLAGA